MNAIIFLTVICCGYYIFNKYFEEHVEERYHYYFGGFVGVYCVLLYLYHFEYPFVYQLLKNIYETNNQPLYNFNAQVSNAELFQAQHPNFNIKETLLQKQGGRCYACSNFIMSSDAHNTKLKYKTPLQNGGQNSIDNLGLVCPHCFGFTH